MTPQERQLIAQLFERLAALENQPRDAEAEQAIRDGLAKAPHAVYALVQTVLVQDEALKQADAHIQELEAALQGEPEGASQPKGFLDNMRDTLFGRDEAAGRGAPRGSVPSVRPGDDPGAPGQYRSSTGATWGGGMSPGPQGGMAGAGMPGAGMPGAGMPGAGMPGAGMPGDPYGRGGGSFLGTAAATAAGMIGGGLLMQGIRGMLGARPHQGPAAGALDNIASGESKTPWRGNEDSDLAHQAGVDDIGHGRHSGFLDTGNDDSGHDAAHLADDQFDDEDSEFDDGMDGDPDDTDYA